MVGSVARNLASCSSRQCAYFTIQCNVVFLPTYGHQARLATHVTLFQGWQSGSVLTPAPYEEAQASDVMCKQAAHPGSGLAEGSNILHDTNSQADDEEVPAVGGLSDEKLQKECRGCLAAAVAVLQADPPAVAECAPALPQLLAALDFNCYFGGGHP